VSRTGATLYSLGHRAGFWNGPGPAAHEPSTREKLRRVVEGSLMGVSELGSDEHDRLVRSGDTR
jgi:hypothetical protein